MNRIPYIPRHADLGTATGTYRFLVCPFFCTQYRLPGAGIPTQNKQTSLEGGVEYVEEHGTKSVCICQIARRDCPGA